MPSVPFITGDGEVTLDDVEIELVDGTSQVTGQVSADTWAHIVDRDVFGSASRSPDGVLVSDPTPVKLWLSGGESAFTEGQAPEASAFVITRAERRLEGAPDGGEVWVGVTYGAGDDWAAAVDMLAELGFMSDGGSGSVRSFSSGDGSTVVLSVDRDARLATVVVTTPVDGGVADSGELETLRLLNGFNRGFPAGSLALDDGRLRVSEAFPVLDDTPVAETLEALAGGLVGLTQMVAEVMPSVASGSVTASDALARFFG
jgi:hypothetical protein